MRFAYAILICAAAVFGAALPGRSSSATPAPSASPIIGTPDAPTLPSPKPAPEDPKVTKIAVREFLAWQNGTVDRGRYSDEMNANISDDLLTKSSAGLAHLGALQKTTFQGISIAGKGYRFYTYLMTCANGTVRMQFGFDPKGKIGLLYFL
ncbi:MAG: DUF3887 domain-containing protein [Candidatus Eremiobacteraeota bacterium]|nr:DUF3887 domain-containing protein [Candidatus Eremiobacteraeota bacterium]